MNKPQQQSNGLGIASLILGILSVTGFSIFTGIPAIITGIMGLKQPASKGMSIAGIVMGGLSIVVALLIVLFFVIMFAISATDDSHPPYDYDVPPVQHDSSYYQQQT